MLTNILDSFVPSVIYNLNRRLKPDIVNPLSVSVQRSGKKRLILDLRHGSLDVKTFL